MSDRIVGLCGRILCQRMGGARINWDTDARIFEVRSSLQNASGGSAASEQRLKPGLVQKAPSVSLSEVFWIKFNRAKVDC